MGERAVKILVYVIGGAILGDMLVHVAGTNALFSGLGNLLGSTYQAAAGAYSKSSN